MLTYQNINNNNTRGLDSKLYRDKYFDFMLYKGSVISPNYNVNENLIVDFSTLDIEDGILYSTVQWKNAINNGVLLEDIGFTGIDNGLIHFEKDRISNKDFLKILTGSTYNIQSGDTRLFLTPITGNTKNFVYPMFLENKEEEKYISFKGGFYQGFYKLFGFDYQVMPNGPDFEWNLQFKLRPRTDYEVETYSVNYIHPENKGIFFYMGTRAENKFINFYKTNSADTESMKIESIANDGYFDTSTCDPSGETYDFQNHVVDEQYYDFLPENKPSKETYDGDADKRKKHHYGSSGNTELYISDFYSYKYDETSVNCQHGCDGGCGDCIDEFFGDDYIDDSSCSVNYFQPEYIEPEVDIDEKTIEDTFGHLITKKGYFEIETDNKFLMFDRTRYGLTVKDWIDGTKVTLTGRNDWGNINYFPLMNRTKTGFTVNDIYAYQEENTIPYNIYKDVKNNAFALKITEDGAIGYKYSVLDCNAENKQHYTVMEEYSKPDMVKNDEWNDIIVKIVILNPTVTYEESIVCGDPNKGKRKMKLFFFVNGNLVFISKELDEFNFKELNDISLKQEAVPFNISLGGGTQGLLESILPDYYKASEYVYPIEKDFCGTFLGDIKSFKIYDGYIDNSTLKNLLMK